MIPDFDDDGLLPPGIHWTTWEIFSKKFGTTLHRGRILEGLRAALEVLVKAGCTAVYIDGSFVTSKDIPSDFDACWDIQGVDPNLLDPVFLQFDNKRAAQKAKYLGELFPACWVAEQCHPFRTFIEFFQIDKHTGAPKGIVAIDLRGWKP